MLMMLLDTTAGMVTPKTPAVIGRKVQDCHPRKSLEKVEEILSGSRQGLLIKPSSGLICTIEKY